jgi:hypothetical protein
MTFRSGRRRLAALLGGAILFALGEGGTASADQVVQVPLSGLLDARPVSTLTGGVVVPWTVGIDQVDGFMTLAAALSLRQTGPALPDDGKFAANARHPDVVLNFSNAALADSPQAHHLTGVGMFAFSVPAATYSKLILFFSSSYGDSRLTMTMTYADGTTSMTALTLPDWGLGGTLPPTCFQLIAGLHKWTKQGMSVDTPSHTITGVDLFPTATKVLTRVEVSKTSAAQTLIFWGATGMATSPIDGGVDGGGGGVDSGATDGTPEGVVETDTALPEAPASPADAAAPDLGGVGAPPDAAVPKPPDAAVPKPPATATGGCAIGSGGGRPFGWILLLVSFFSRRRRFARGPGRSYR